MKKAVYEKPEFDFKELFLFDGVAEKCWGYKSHTYTLTVYRDKDHNDVFDSGENVIATHEITVKDAGSCNAAYESLYSQLKAVAVQYDKAFMESPGVKENAKGTIGDNLYIPIS